MQLSVRVQPKASRERVVGLHGRSLKISLTAVASEGQANRALIRFLARCLGMAPSSVRILRGESSRVKVVELIGADRTMVTALVARAE